MLDGRSEEQRITVSAGAGKFKLQFGGKETELKFNALASEVRDALRAMACSGAACVIVNGGPGSITGSNPYVVQFTGSLDTTDVEQIGCGNGAEPLTGGSGCTVTTMINGVEGTIARYHADGTPSSFSALGSNRIDGKGAGDETPQKGLHFSVPKLTQIALDESGTATDGDIYVTQFGDHLVDIFGSSGEFKGQLTEFKEGVTAKPLEEVCGVAVDGAGDVYVADLSTGIHKYDPAANPVTNADSVANFTTVTSPCALGAGAGPTAGFLFAGRLNGGLFKLDAGTGVVKYEVSNGPVTTVTVDPTSGHVLTATGGKVQEFDASGASSATELGAIEAGSEVRGVAVDGSTGKGGTVYLSRAGTTHLDVYGPFVQVPLVTTKPATEVAGTTATLNGTISADGSPSSTCHFQYITEGAYQANIATAKAEGLNKAQIAEAAFTGAASAPCEPPGPFTGSATNPVSAAITGLELETKYEFRLVGENANGEIASSPESLETQGKPFIEGGTASQVTATSALISGAVNPRGIETEAAVEYVSKEQFEVTGFSGATVVLASNLPGFVTGTGDLSAATGTGDLSTGSKTIANLATSTGAFAVGQSISGTGIPPGTTIAAITLSGLELSAAASASATAVALNAGSNKVTNLSTSSGTFGPGQAISGPGIAEGTTILSAQAGQLTLSKVATEPVSGAALLATGPQPVSVALTGLTADTPYVFRLTAESSAGVADPGKAGSFTTLPPLGPLPDGRAYELVTPAQKIGEPYPPEPAPREGLGGTCQACTPGWDKERMPMQSTPDGSGLVYEGGPFAGGIASGANEYRARRGAGGWQTAFLSDPRFRDEIGTGQGFKAFSTDLSKAIILQADPSLSEEAPTDFANLYLQEEGKEALTTLITSEPPNRSPGINDLNSFLINYAGANAGTGAAPAFTHVIFQANDALTPDEGEIAPEAPPVDAEETDLYEWSGGQLHLVNVLPGNGEAAPDAVFGSGLLTAAKGGQNFDFDHAISDDGSRIFWSTKPSGQVYVREGGTTTTEIPDPGKFITATPDGSKVLLSDGILYDLESATPTDLTEGEGGFAGIAGASEDLSRIYFVDTKALTPPDEENANAEAAEAGKPNLYLWEEGSTTFIARLAATDNEAGGAERLGTWHAAPGNRLAQATPDGRFLAFESRASLTGYDNRINEGEGCAGPSKKGLPQCFEVFEYDAQSGTLSCPSCRPSGEAPLGDSNLALIAGEKEAFPQPQNLPPAGEGRLFFESRDALLQRDTNRSIQDVYEWEPNGVGDCTRPRGCLSLITSGSSPKDSHFINASDTGNDVFFDTRSQLVPQDKDEFLDIYDARVGGGFEEETAAPCEGESCAGPIPPPPPFESPSSGVPHGPEGRPPTHCRRGYVRKGTKCVRKHRKHKHHHRHAKHHRGGSR